MSCRHDLANGTCTRCYPSNPYGRTDSDRIDPGPEEDYSSNLEGPDAVPAHTVAAEGAKVGKDDEEELEDDEEDPVEELVDNFLSLNKEQRREALSQIMNFTDDGGP